MGALTPQIGLALIVKNEEARLGNLLSSIEGAFDHIVLVDTGSTDMTVAIFEDWAASKRQAVTVKHFDWCDDFAAARNFADSHLHTDWKVWADADDVIHGAMNIRGVIESIDPSVVGLVCGYDYAQHPDTGASVCHLKRERIVKTGHGKWQGRVHEAQEVTGGTLMELPDHVVLWKHQKTINGAYELAQQSNDRNLKILRRWNDEEPNNPRVLAYLGTELAVQGHHIEAVGFYHHYLDLQPGWIEERAQVHRKLSASLMALGRDDEALQCAYAALDVMPQWPDSYNTLADIYVRRGEFDKAQFWAQQAEAIGPPQTMLIVNPLEYTFLPRSVLAHALAGQGKFDEAVAKADEALALFPDGTLAQHQKSWRFESKRAHTAQTYSMMAEQLIAHDEQLKAVELLRCVPHFAIDHPRIVELRAMLGERLSWIASPEAFEDHYNTGGSKPEDFIADEFVDELCAALPRAEFLLNGLKEQMA